MWLLFDFCSIIYFGWFFKLSFLVYLHAAMCPLVFHCKLSFFQLSLWKWQRFPPASLFYDHFWGFKHYFWSVLSHSGYAVLDWFCKSVPGVTTTIVSSEHYHHIAMQSLISQVDLHDLVHLAVQQIAKLLWPCALNQSSYSLNIAKKYCLCQTQLVYLYLLSSPLCPLHAIVIDLLKEVSMHP